MYFIYRLDAIKAALCGLTALSIALMAASVILSIFAGYTLSRRPMDEGAKKTYHCMRKYAILCLVTALITILINVLLPSTREAKELIEGQQYQYETE